MTQTTTTRTIHESARATLKRHPKHKDVSGSASAEYRVLSGDTGVAVAISEFDAYGISHPGVVVRLSVHAARALAARLVEEAAAAETLGAPPGPT
jgi:hypothetical protein